MTDILQQENQRIIPAPVRLALGVLAGLESARAEKLRKALPAYAMTLHRQGKEVTEQVLKHALANGDDAVMGPRMIFNRVARTITQRYEQVTARFPKAPEQLYEDNPELPLHARLALAATRGDLPAVRQFVEMGADVHAGKDTVLFCAASRGHLEIMKYLDSLDIDLHANNEAAFRAAAKGGHLDVVAHLADRGANIHVHDDEALSEAADKGHVHIVKFLIDKSRKSIANMGKELQLAASFGYLDIVRELTDGGIDVNTYHGNSALRLAITHGFPDIVEHLADKGADIHDNNNQALFSAALNGRLDIVKFLAKRGMDLRAERDLALRIAVENDHMDVVKFLVDKGLDPFIFNAVEQMAIRPVLDNMDRWMEKTGTYPPKGLEDKPPEKLDLAAVDGISRILRREGYAESQANRYAFEAVSLFGTSEKVMDYFEKWAKPGSQPLHDAIYMIKLPENTLDKGAWADAVMACGPQMANLLKFADKLARPMKSADGKTWSPNKTRDETARFAYPCASANMKLAALFNRHAKDENSFNRALGIAARFRQKTENRIPDITIDGEAFDMPGATFGKLPDGDYRGLVLGELTDCCQSIGSAGTKCAEHGFTSENGGFYVVTTKEDEIIGQSWAWRGINGELVLDSLEPLGDRVKPEQWTRLAREFAKTLKRKGIDMLHIGTGGRTPKNLPFEIARMPAHPVDYMGYRDSIQQYKIA